jgi:hypothetical protein
MDAGWVVVEVVGDELIVAIELWAPWTLSLLHVYAGPGPVPSSEGAYVPGLFPFSFPFDPAQSDVAVAIPVAELGVACGDPLKVAVHAEVNGEGGEETAWAEGPEGDFPSWGMSFEHELCCP